MCDTEAFLEDVLRKDSENLAKLLADLYPDREDCLEAAEILRSLLRSTEGTGSRPREILSRVAKILEEGRVPF